jgi:hypothetical protein
MLIEDSKARITRGKACRREAYPVECRIMPASGFGSECPDARQASGETAAGEFNNRKTDELKDSHCERLSRIPV